MLDVGPIALAIAWVLAIYAIVMSLVGALRQQRDFITSAEHAALAVWGLTVIAVADLLLALVTHDFNIEYVAHYSSSTLPLNYTVAALWGGQAGSLLFWLLILTSMTAIVVMQNRYKNRELMPYVNATLMLTALFFLSMLLFVTPPFERLAFTPGEGQDLNPLLQNYWMTIHPPALYTGFVGCSIPFAFGMAALATGRLDDVWIRTTRRWTLLAWFFLSLGNLFGAEWAYRVLGWGGYWAWDPVENAAFMPWLTCTAFLHSVMIQEKKNMLKVWNMVLVILTFLLTIFGTFLTRSGVISSVHSFTQSGLGPFFIGFLGIMATMAIGLLVWRLPQLKSENELDSILSREATFLLNNLILVGIAFAVFWGTIFPVISEAVRGIKITVGPPFFNRVNAPLGLILLFLTGVGPVIAWRRASASSLKRSFLWPTVLGVGGGFAMILAGIGHYYAVLSFSICIFVGATIAAEFYRGVRARQAMIGENVFAALAHLMGKNRRRYGGYVVHIGIVMMYLAITGTSAFRVEQLNTVSPGESFDVGNYKLRYDKVEAWENEHAAHMAANIAVLKDGKQIDTLKPEKRFYKKPEQPTTEVAIRSTFGTDLYLVLGSYDDATKKATIQAYINPLVGFLGWGGIVLAIGTFITIWPARTPHPAAAYAPSRGERMASE
ncbi:MAG: heme lyase CcmF/NrfE family subunit [Deltaproteobacteria bacterium]|nr:heme lyase CcmF/NrfE family subunit [Planctomycetota bacterium]MBI3782900.1 heme lyase CcmF/NrfE family subunit [Deltaproteobacteria bacterium]